MRKVLYLLLMLILIAGCSSDKGEATEKKAETKTAGVVVAQLPAKEVDCAGVVDAVQFERLDELKQIIENGGCDLNLKGPNDWNALMFAAITENIEAAGMLLDAGADMNAVDNRGWTALMFAIEKKNIEITKMLIDNGADMNAKHKDGGSALLLAILYKNLDIVKMLLDNGADVNIKDKFGGTNLAYAVRSENVDIVKAILDKGVDINEGSQQKGLTALMIAAKLEDGTVIIKVLLDNGADVNKKRPDGKTALKIAKSRKRTKNIELLKAAGANL